MTVLQSPKQDSEPVLIALAPQAYVRGDLWMGLMEAIAWVGSRDKRFSDAAYWYLHEREGRRRDDSFPLWLLMNDDLKGHYSTDVRQAEAEVMTAGLNAIGRYQDGGFEPMNPLLWVDVGLAFDDVPDSIRPKDIRNNLGKPQWSHIRLQREAVLARWPNDLAAVEAPAEAATEVPPKASRAEFQAWVRSQISAGFTQEKVGSVFRKAIPGKRVDLNREQVRDIYRTEYAAAKGTSVRSGPRVIG